MNNEEKALLAFFGNRPKSRELVTRIKFYLDHPEMNSTELGKALGIKPETVRSDLRTYKIKSL